MLRFLKKPTWAIAYKLPSFPEISALIAYKVIGYKKKIEYQFGTVTLAVPKMESALSTALGNLTSIWRPSHKLSEVENVIHFYKLDTVGSSVICLIWTILSNQLSEQDSV